MSPQKLFEKVLPPFAACIRAGAMAVMPALNDLSGVPCSVNRWLLTDILREQLGFDGMTISDANAIDECVNHGVAADRADAARQALEAGMDMDMTRGCFREELKSLVESSQINQAVLDRAVADVLRVKFELVLCKVRNYKIMG